LSRLGNFLLSRDSYSVVVEQSTPELIARLQAAFGSDQSVPRSEATLYTGEVSESGFILRRVAAHPKDTRAAVVARGELEPNVGSTLVHVTIRHGRLMVLFGWLLALLACGDAVATTQLAQSNNLAAAAILASFAVLWHILLWRNIRQVAREVRALLMTDQ
jgi:hypothetical protein